MLPLHALFYVHHVTFILHIHVGMYKAIKISKKKKSHNAEDMECICLNISFSRAVYHSILHISDFKIFYA